MNTHAAISSMRKSASMLGVAALVCLLPGFAALILGRDALAEGSGALMILIGSCLAALAYAGVLSAQRQRRIESGESDLFLLRNATRSESAVVDAAVPQWSGLRRSIARRVFGHHLLVGDAVRVKPLREIEATLDANGCLDGMPFMDEMKAFCGQDSRVYRVVDKIYDYGRSRQMRRLDDCVLLVSLRCDGSAHAQCEAACYLIWKAAWLESQHTSPKPPASMTNATRPSEIGDRLSCQYTELTQASKAVQGANVRGFFGPLIVGNVSLGAFAVVGLTRAFNAFQSWRGGATYPSQPTPSNDKTIRGESLTGGEWVRVKSPAEIARALDQNSKNRGLWFDRDMLKHCGQIYRVRGRVEKIIDVGSCKIIPMKTPCIVLDGVHYSGEFQGFGEQHDFLYWREAWLNRIAAPAE